MTPLCAGPDITLGAAVRTSIYLECQARTLGENGFQLLANGPILGSLRNGTFVIFVALIGYRLIFGQAPQFRSYVRYAIRIGFAMTLAASWPAFQTLVFRVVVDGPVETLGSVLPSAGLQGIDQAGRVQAVYDIVRKGVAIPASDVAPRQSAANGAAQSVAPPVPEASAIALPASPQSASVLVVSVVGVEAGLKVVIGILLALGPIFAFSLLFDATLAFFSGWVRALAGSALGLVGVTIIGALSLINVEAEIARTEALQYALPLVGSGDAQGFATLITLFAVLQALFILVAYRVTAGFSLSFMANDGGAARSDLGSSTSSPSVGSAGSRTSGQIVNLGQQDLPSRASVIAVALASQASQDGRRASIHSINAQRIDSPGQSGGTPSNVGPVAIGLAGRRNSFRTSGLAKRRNRSS